MAIRQGNAFGNLPKVVGNPLAKHLKRFIERGLTVNKCAVYETGAKIQMPCNPRTVPDKLIKIRISSTCNYLVIYSCYFSKMIYVHHLRYSS